VLSITCCGIPPYISYTLYTLRKVQRFLLFEVFVSESYSKQLFSEKINEDWNSSWYDPFKPKHNFTGTHSLLMDVPLRSFILSAANQGRSGINSLPHSPECMISFLGSRRDWRNPAGSERSLLIPLMCVCVCVCVRVPFPSTKVLLCLPAPNQGMIIKTKIIVIEPKLGDHQRAACDSIWALREALGLWIRQILLGPNLNGPQRVCLPPFVYMAEIWNKCEHDTPRPLRSSAQPLSQSSKRVCIYIHCAVLIAVLHRQCLQIYSLAHLQTECLLYIYNTRKAKITSDDPDISRRKDMMPFLGKCLFEKQYIFFFWNQSE